MKFLLAGIISVVGIVQSLMAVDGAAQSLVKDGDRIVFVGDSITGQGGNFGPGGFVALVKEGLDTARPGSNVTGVALGGSGQGVGSWMSVEKKSRETESSLDVKNVGVKENLDKPANVLIIMLGMNDSLSPYTGEDQKGLDDWAKRYRELIGVLRERCKPRVVGLATVTPNTEDPKSPKNIVLAEMAKRLAVIAKELNCVVLPSGETVVEVLQKGRTCKPDFHVTSDFVHANNIGHVAIAIGMLKGLGEKEAAGKLYSKYIEKFFNDAKGALPALSYTIVPTSLPLDSDQASFDIAYYWTPSTPDGKTAAKATLSVPAGWKAEPAELSGLTGTFKVSGKLDHLVNVLKLGVKDSSSSKETEIKIPAPWLICYGFNNQQAWEAPSWKYAPEKGVLPGEEGFMKGLGFGKTPEGWKGNAPKWAKYLASVDYTGGNSPANVCMYAVSYSTPFEGAFGVRWITSENDMPVKITLGCQTFAGAMGLCVLVNGERLYSGTISSEPNRKVVKDAVLKKGLNCLVFKANHCTWQWQFSIDVSSDKPGDLAGLTVSTVPPAEK
ncbi:MAG: GDSL-type esterase/lipase family protein [Victivallales bacterium]|jgi:lysophospholipase L1-like esterase